VATPRTPAKIYLHGCRYVIGEDERPVADIANFSDFLVQNQMIDDADLWGWDRYRLTGRSAIELGAEAAQRTLAAFGPSPRSRCSRRAGTARQYGSRIPQRHSDR
jgi:hypothetical protein